MRSTTKAGPDEIEQEGRDGMTVTAGAVSDTDALASPFVAVVPVRRWLFLLLTAPLPLTRRFPSFVFDRAALIHFGQWGVLARPRRKRPGGPRSTLVFVSVFDGEVDQYIVTFASLLPVRFSQVFGFCVGFPGPVPSGPLLTYIERHKHPSQFFHAAYGRRTMLDIRGALWITERLGPLVAGAGHLSPDQLRDRLRVLAAERDRDARRVYRTPRPTLTRQTVVGRNNSLSFTTMTPIVGGRERELVELLTAMQADEGAHTAFDKIPSTHYARFAVIDPLFDREDEPMRGVPAHLLFSVQFDCDEGPDDATDRYLAELFDQIKQFPVDPWSCCEGYPLDAPRRLFIDHLRYYAVSKGVFVPGVTATAEQISVAAEIERRFERLRADHLDRPSPATALAADFTAAFAGARP
jgi:hypothetical protein